MPLHGRSLNLYFHGHKCFTQRGLHVCVWDQMFVSLVIQVEKKCKTFGGNSNLNTCMVMQCLDFRLLFFMQEGTNLEEKNPKYAHLRLRRRRK